MDAGLTLDHLAVVAPDLAEGVAHVAACLDLPVPEGGRHPAMGTHNHLLRLGDALFLEVIAVDPAAPPPARARWFGLDDAARVRAEWDAGFRLRGFVARTRDLDGALAARPDLFGSAAELTRGDLSWRFGVRADGMWPMDGAIPCIMDWGPAGNPACRMPDPGARLVDLTVTHPEPGALAALYRDIGLSAPPTIRPGPALRYAARIATPSGLRILS